jgi:hypothetical protein
VHIMFCLRCKAVGQYLPLGYTFVRDALGGLRAAIAEQRMTSSCHISLRAGASHGTLISGSPLTCDSRCANQSPPLSLWILCAGELALFCCNNHRNSLLWELKVPAMSDFNTRVEFFREEEYPMLKGKRASISFEA